MFDLDYNPGGTFIPISVVVNNKMANAVSSEELAETKENVEVLSDTVATQSESIAENSAAIASNSTNIANNSSAISNEATAREAAIEEVNEKINNIPKFKTEVVDVLPAEGEAGAIYLLKDEGKDTYSEYVYAGGAWEKLGSDVDLAEYATKEEVEEVNAKVDAIVVPDVTGFATKEEVEAVNEKVEAIEIPDVTGFATKEEVSAVDEKVDSIVIPDVSDFATKEEVAVKADADNVYTKAEADEMFLKEHQDISKKVDWVESTPGRNHIVLKNHDSILGTATDNSTYNLAMVSKWDVADFGTSGLHMNLNSKDGIVTINDDKQIATVDQIPVVDDFATKEEVETVNAKVDAIVVPDVTGFATKNEVEAVNEKVDAIVIPDVTGFATKEEVAVKADAEALENETRAREEAIEGLREEIVALPKFKIVIVDVLPSVGEPATFYLVATGSESENEYDEYVFVNNKWEKIGTQTLDLSEYAKVADVNTLSGAVETLNLEFDSVDEKLAGLAEANAAQDAEIAKKADIDQIPAVDGFATKEEVEAVNEKVDAIVVPSLDGYATVADLSAAIDSIVLPDMSQYYTKGETDEALAGKVSAADFAAFVKDFESVKKAVGALGGNVTWSANTVSELKSMLTGNSGTIKLLTDVTEEDGTFYVAAGIFANNKVTLNLNGHSIVTSGRTNFGMIKLRGTQELTVTGGSMTNTNTSGSNVDNILRSPVFIAGDASILNLKLGSSRSATTMSIDPVVVCESAGTINISSGNYSSPNSCVIYCVGGTINISGGVFRSTGTEGSDFLINCQDAPREEDKAKIVVTGGKFYDFDPANNKAEGEGTNFVAEGYQSVASTVVEDGVEHIVYEVKKA